MIAFSFENLAPAAGLAASTTFTEAEAAVGLRHPERPHLRGYTADLSAGRITLDFGSATALDVVALIHANFTSATIQGNASDAWGAPTYSQAITLARSGNRRYHHAHRPTTPAFNFRFLSIRVPAGATTDGAVRWALGGIWAGLLTEAPREIRDEPIETKIEAKGQIETEDGRPIQEITYDAPYWRVLGTRNARGAAELDAWREIDGRWAEAPGGAALVLMRASKPNEVYLMRQAAVSEWPNSAVFSTSTLEAVEVIAV